MSEETADTVERIAIVGMSGRFPGAPTLDAFWDNLRRGVHSRRELTEADLEQAGVPRAQRERPDWVRAAYPLDGPTHFDAGYFGYSPREAEVLDPQQRVFMETALEALEDAGYDPERFPEAIAAFASTSTSSYLFQALLRRPELLQTVGLYNLSLANDKDFVATRTSHRLGLRGPSATVQTGCSSALVAVHLACQSLLSGECEMALAGGVSVAFPQTAGYAYQPGMIISPDGLCRAYDARSQGTIFGSGVGVVVLKRLSEAVRDRDTIHAVILGSAVNNDGSDKAGFTAPSVEGQAAAIAEALGVAGVEPEDVQYVEGHGTATALGDPVEVAALNQAFGGARSGTRRCVLGTVKANIGHLDSAAGVAGLLKTVLALKHAVIPPTPHFQQPNPAIDFDGGPFFVTAEPRPWDGAVKRRAGVSSFGLGGTNVHVVLEEPPRAKAAGTRRAWHVLPLSARTPRALEEATSRLAAHLERTPELELADVASTLQRGRRTHEHRRALLCRDLEDARAALADPRRYLEGSSVNARRPVVFLFPGHGSHHVDMGRALYEAEPVFRKHLDACRDALTPHLGQDLRSVLFPDQAPNEAEALLERMTFAQPAMFAVEYALAQLWRSFGVEPEAMVGHSTGEYVAACLAGVFSLPDALALVAARGRLMDALPPGGMLSVSLPEDALAPLLPPGVSVAAVNAPALVVVAGPIQALEALEATLAARDVSTRRVRALHAFHSEAVAPMVEGFLQELSRVRLSPPKRPYVSSLTGTWITAAQATDPRTWARHLREPVRFAQAATTLLGSTERLYLEVGPGQALGTFVRQCAPPGNPPTALTSLPRPRDGQDAHLHLTETAARLWLAGASIDLAKLYGKEPRRRVPLPPYPFQRERFDLLAVASVPGARLPAFAVSEVPRENVPPALECAVPTWQRIAGAPVPRFDDQRWLVMEDANALGGSIARLMEARGADVLALGLDATWAPLEERMAADGGPDHVAFLWPLSPAEGSGAVDRVLHGLLELARRLGPVAAARPVTLAVITSGAQDVTGEEPLRAWQATASGVCRVLSQEYPGLRCRAIDVSAPRPEEGPRWAEQLVAELGAGAPAVVALRGPHRFTESFEPVVPSRTAASPLRQGGVYLIMGDLEAGGLALAEALATTARARLVLLTDTVPQASHLERLGSLERAGAQGVLLAPMGAGDPEPLLQGLLAAEARFGAIHGVFFLPQGTAGAVRQSLADATDEAWAPVFRSRVGVLGALAGALQGRAPDFVTVCSSLTAVVGGVGRGVLAAAHAAMDTFAAQQNRGPGPRWYVVDLDAWQEEVIPVWLGLLAASGQGGRWWISQGPPRAEEPDAGGNSGTAPDPASGSQDTGRHPRPPLATPYVAPRGDSERRVVELWQEMLGIDALGVDDDFFELGGHSLLATQVLARVRSAFAVELPLRAFFEAPTPAKLAERVDAATAVGAPANILPPLTPVPRDGQPLPLSFSQQSLWFLDQLHPGGSAYNMPSALRLEGRVDTAALEQAFTELVRRHEALRTTFHADGGAPLQRIHPPAAFRLAVMDVSSHGALEAEAHRLAAEEQLRPFDLAAGPLLRAMLIRLAEARHVLVVTMHHIVSDGWSLGVLVREMVALYQAFASGQPSSLAPLPVQYADHAAWQRAWLRGEALESRIRWWRQQLEGAPAFLTLPTDFPRPPVASFRGDAVPVALPRALSESLAALCQAEGVTPFMALLAGFQALLSRYAGQDDVSVGSAMAGRRFAEQEALIGFFVNTLVYRTRLHADPTFRELLARVRDTTLEAHAHQDLPFEKLVEALRPERDPSRSPLFQVNFTFQNMPMGTLEAPGLRFEPIPIEGGTGRFDLTLVLTDTPRGLTGTLEYASDLFRPETARRLVTHLHVLLEEALRNPQLRLSELPLLTDAERHEVLVKWNASDADFPREASLHTLFEAQVRSTPDAQAVVFEAQHLTYRQLDARANQLAHHLRALGVGREVIVGLCVERSVEGVVGMLAILKAGGAFLCLDPAHPTARLALMLEDSGLQVLLTQDALMDVLPLSSSCVPCCFDADAAAISRHPTTPPEVAVHAGNLAYVIYTSGSTGRPKGTLLAHRGLCNSVLAAVRAHALSPESRVLQFASPTFDAAILETFAPLLEGATLVLAPRERLLPDAPLRALLTEQEITTVTLTPSVLAQLTSENLASLRTVISAGEALSPEVARRWSEGRTLLNAYGPTEATVCASITPGPIHADAPGIGKPWPNTRLYVLDAHLRPVPVGVPGELFIGGVGLARGYLGRPDLTAGRFLPDPFGTEPGARMYRTGDRVRWRQEGDLEYLGRTDFQVKLRGLRIELGEVEAALQAHATVLQAVALVREDAPGLPRLVAYVVANGDGLLDVAALRVFLQQRLPEYMVPATLVVLEALPLTSSGKVDRRALPSPDLRASGGPGHVPPGTPTEERLAALWKPLLQVEQVGSEDHFFELGGHSLLATQLVSRIRADFGVELALQALFEAPTLAALARRLDAARPEDASRAPPLLPVPRTGALPLSFAQQRLWLIEQIEPGGTAYNIPTVLRIRGRLDRGALGRAFSGLVERHEALRTVFATQDGEPVQIIQPPTEFALPEVDLSDAPDSERVRQCAEAETQRPFNLAEGPLLRALLLRVGEQEHVLVVTMHHIVSDGWSMALLVREVASLYAAFSSGLAPSLAPLALQYSDFAAWQRLWLQGDVLSRQLDFWRQQLSGAPALLELPTDRPRPAVQSSRGAWVPVHLPQPLTSSLLDFCQQQGATPFMALLALWQLLLSRYSGQLDISVGAPIAGRTRSETEGLIGFFVNTLVLRSHVGPRSSFRQLLAQVRATTLSAFEHQHLPFEKLVEELQPQRSLRHSPLFQVMFTLRNTPDAAIQVEGGASALELSPVESDVVAAKFDLNLSLAETPEGLAGEILYRTDLFDAATITRMGEHLSTLTETALATPDAPVGDLSLLSAGERAQVMEGFNATEDAFVAPCPLHTLIEEQAARHPERPAVACAGEVLTYGTLDTRANQLAWRLRSLGVGPDTRVGLCLERSVDIVVALLGVWKAGGAYVPLEPSQPAQRLRALVNEIAAPVVVTASRHAEAFTSLAAHVVRMDTDAQVLAAQPREAPVHGATARSLAYILFTSGSTGRPKGVAVEHAQLFQYVRAATERLRLEECASFALLSTFAADLGNTVLFPALCTGGLLHVLPQELASSPAEVAAYFQRHAVDCMKIVPSHLAALLTAAEPRHVLPRKKLVLGGESSSPALLDQVRALAPDCELFNHYGPTETTVGVIAGPVEVRPQAPVPLGRALAHTRLYVLDERLRPVPVGVPGELFIGGAQVTRGYLGRPELTAERYLPDVHSPVQGARMYRSGDRVRWLPDGRVEFIGRADFQVKVRGFRVEPGEVTAALSEHPAVREAWVVAREDVPGDTRLVAYVVSAAEPVSAGELRAFLQERLPAYMLPAAFVHLDAMPLTSNGKLDRKALPAPEDTTREATFIAPRSPTEERLAALWAGLLRTERISVEEDFFALGGHSLLATQVVSRVRQTFEVELPVRALFEAPTVAALAARIDSAARTQGHALRPVPRNGDLPLSFAQQRLWFIDQLQPLSASYHMPTFVRLVGPLDEASLRSALDELVRRHEALRTTFVQHEGQPFQRVSATAQLPLVVVESGALPLEPQLREEASRPFQLDAGPLARAKLWRLGPTEHVLALTLHHIVSDGWSMGVLVREVAALYEAFSQGRPSPLPPLPVQYADYAVWQRQWLQGDVLQAQLEYWKQQLSGASPLELPTDKPRPPVQSANGAHVPVVLPAETSRQLKAMGLQEGVTPFMLLLGTFQVLLSRYAGQEDITVGSPIAGRQRGELEDLIGFFVNTLVLRARVAPDLSFRALLAQVKETALGAYAHQDVPFERLVEELQPTRDMSRAPLFQVLFSLQGVPGTEPLQSQALSLHPLEADTATSKFELQLILSDTPEGFRGTLAFNTDLFDASTASRMAAHFGRLVDALLTRPDAPLASVSMLSEDERRQVLVEWNTTASDYPRDASIHSLFHEQSLRTPDAVAVEAEGTTLTYRQLDARANQLARFLLTLGLGPEPRIGVCLHRNVDLVVGLLGILKAGGCYVPLDPSYPTQRLAFLLGDSDVAAVLTQQSLTPVLPESSRPVVCLDSDGERIARQPVEAPHAPVRADQLAYVTYTSGSTGTPKGVAIPHRGVVRLLIGSRFVKQGPAEIVLQLAPLAFDASTLEIWGALLHGGRLVLFPQAVPSLEELGQALLRHRVSVLWLTAALFDQMQQEQPQALASVAQLLAGGDVLSVPRVRERLALSRGLVNGYGPTESTTFTTCHVMAPGDAVGSSVPIGRPIANTQVYVLDAAMQPVPVGVPGELYIGGDGLARGYLGRPALTAERFVPHPFAASPGERLYRSGDRVCWSEDGTLRFLGRMDFQVKLRGFRIEPGEVEAVLREHADVTEATVLVREDVPGDKRLVAYVVPAELDTARLRDHLRQRLPEYLVPSTFVAMKALPLSAHGKVDRKALPAPEALRGSAIHEPPRNALETQLVSLWEKVLGREGIGIHDHFFELGGHSLLATQLVSRIRSALEVELPVRALFEAPTVAALAARIDSAARTQAPALRPVPRDGDLPLSFAQQRLWFIDQLQPLSAAYHMPTFVRLVGPLDEASLRSALDELVRRHEALRTTFVQHEGQPLQRISATAHLPLVVVESGAHPLEPQLHEEASRPFQLDSGPLARAKLWRLGSTEHVLALTLHHIVSDGWSMGVLVREVAALYEAFSQGRPSPLPPLPVQYADYAVWQRQWLQGDVLQAQLEYWKQQLSGAAPLELPTDKPRPPVQSSNGAQVPVVLPAETSRQLKALSLQEGVTPFMLLLGSFQVLLSRYSGQEDVTVGSPIAGRQRGELEGLIGFFVNTQALRIQVDGQKSFVHLLRQVKETALGAYAHQDVPFERLVEELHPTRDMSRAPLFQVLFALQNAPAAPIREQALSLHPMDVDGSTSKFELQLILSDSPEGFQGALGFNTDLFEVSTASRMAAHFGRLVDALLGQPDAPLASVSMLGEDERRQVLVEWNNTEASYPQDSTLPEVFAQVVARFPEKLALECGVARLTYRQLDAQANRLAHHLRGLGVTTDSRVAIALDRSLELVVGLLAILKAGGAYVPLDPSYPHERLAAMVEDARPRVLLTSRALLAKLPESLSTVVLEDVALEGLPTHAPAPSALPLSLAYIDFTSGSSGRPKGVGTPHRAVLRTLFSTGLTHFGPDASFLLLAPISFDASTFEIWGALLHGSRLVIAPPSPPSLEELGALIQRASITTLWLTSGLFSQMVDGHIEGLRPLKHLLTGGDVVSLPHARRVLDSLQLPVTNGYGPTESTVFATAFHLRDTTFPGASLPIGKPLANTRVYILDAHGIPLPVGLPGELFIGGDGLARGYLEQPALTAERFLPDAFSSTPGARLYRTGDKARWRPDGSLEFLGRLDSQVKLRGFRIELPEVEAALLIHPDVHQAAVLLREDVPGDKRLVAYVTAPDTLSAASLRAFLLRHLPEYMVPSAFVHLDALPLTAQAKLDRRALPPPDARATSDYVAPRTPTEALLATLWAELLHKEQVGIHDDFFASGGHSLLAVRLAASIRARTGKSLPLAALFQAPTVEQLATVLDGGPAPTSSLVVIQRGGTRQPFFCVHPAGGNVLAFADLARRLGPEQPVYGLQAQGLDGRLPPLDSIDAMARHYVAALRSAQPHGPYRLGGWSLGAVIAAEMARHLHQAGEVVELLALIEPSPARAAMEDDDSELALHFALDLARLAGLPPRLPAEVIEGGPEALLHHLYAEGQRTGLFSAESGLEELRILLRVFTANVRARTRHTLTPLSVPLTLIVGADSGNPDARGWDALTQRLDVVPVPGDHYTLLHPPQVEGLARVLAPLLEHAAPAQAHLPAAPIPVSYT
ncbi:non-ribosomal peptide synthetase/type I polyketide synthase, partial [Corallococcus exiguus]|uniref:non-ribosomal peptide synthetase/type I polyketide synthase n=1 Tax=Corallococcus exiguus TaxID=83462 RepID=UPI0015618FA7